jgi:hypothetical protein
MERYFESVAVQYDYHLTMRKEQAELWCITFISEPSRGGSKWITFTSSSFDDMTFEQLEDLSCKIGVGFKSESIVDVVDDTLSKLVEEVRQFYAGQGSFRMSSNDELALKYGMPHIWQFSREHSAFDEPILITAAETAFKVVQHDVHLVSNKNFLVGVRNVGGGSNGLTIKLSFDNTGKIEIESPTLIIPNIKRKVDPQRVALDLMRTDTDSQATFYSSLSDFTIKDGFNEYSAKLCGRKKQDVADSCCLYVLFRPCGNEGTLKNMEVEIIPDEYPMNKAIYRHK